MGLLWLWVAVAFVAFATEAQGGSSLRGALEALQRRQRGQMRGPLQGPQDYDALYEIVEPEIDFVSEPAEVIEVPRPKYVIKMIGEPEQRPIENYEYQIVKKNKDEGEAERVPVKESAFRERSRPSSHDRLKDLFDQDNDDNTATVQEAKHNNDAEYAMLLSELWTKYKNNKQDNASPQKNIQKRYPDYWGPVAFKKKRSSGSENDHPKPAPEEQQKPISDVLADPNYNAYELTDDDKNDMRDEYIIAFRPLEDDGYSDLDDPYSYESADKPYNINKRSSEPSRNTFTLKKRSTTNQIKLNKIKMYRSSTGTDPRIIKDLSKIFGDPGSFKEAPVKRTLHNDELSMVNHETYHPPQVSNAHNDTHEYGVPIEHDDAAHQPHGQIHHPGMTAEHLENPFSKDKPISVKKKSIDWHTYFGIDKRNKHSLAGNINQERLRNQYFDTFSKAVIYPYNNGKVKRNFHTPTSDAEMSSKPLESQSHMEKESYEPLDETPESIEKLNNAEKTIVDEVLHAADVADELDTKEEQEIKEKILSKLANEYHKKKMKNALKEEFKSSMRVQENPDNSDSSSDTIQDAKAKRVANKKEKVVAGHAIPMMHNQLKDDFEDEQGAGHYLNGRIEEQHFDKYMGGSGRHRVADTLSVGGSGSCPVLTKIVQRCSEVDLLASDRGQLFLPFCSLHQICYLCAEAPPTICDLGFLYEADSVCEDDMSCQRAARSALMTLKELHDNLADEMDGECEASPCLRATLKVNPSWQRVLQR